MDKKKRGAGGREEEITLSCYRCSVMGSLETAQRSSSLKKNEKRDKGPNYSIA